MVKNVGKTDKMIRIIVGAILLILGLFMFHGVLKFLAIIVGIVLIATAFLGVCLLYLPLGINTNKEWVSY